MCVVFITNYFTHVQIILMIFVIRMKCVKCMNNVHEPFSQNCNGVSFYISISLLVFQLACH